MNESSDEKPKIIVDDDWKARAQAEKEELLKQAEAKKAEANQQADAGQSLPPMPPASFPFLLTTLATQAMASLGQDPDPTEGKPVVRLEIAKHYIDTLGILEEKTKGNLTGEESSMLENLLHELRMLYVSVEKNPPSPI